MTGRYSVNFPLDLKKDAEALAKKQGVSLNQFILWSDAEKVSALKSGLDDLDFPAITYRRSASGVPVPVLRGTGIRVQSIVIANQDWGESPAEIAAQCELPEGVIEQALKFYQAHRAEIDLLIQADTMLEKNRNG